MIPYLSPITLSGISNLPRKVHICMTIESGDFLTNDFSFIHIDRFWVSSCALSLLMSRMLLANQVRQFSNHHFYEKRFMRRQAYWFFNAGQGCGSFLQLMWTCSLCSKNKYSRTNIMATHLPTSEGWTTELADGWWFQFTIYIRGKICEQQKRRKSF